MVIQAQSETEMYGFCASWASVVVGYDVFGRPSVKATTQAAARASRKWVIEPADMTMVRFQTGYRHIARGWSSGATSSSCGVIPTILQKPPSGIALRPYSVSPRRHEKIVGPKPTKYFVTFMPKRLAVIMWPA